MSCCCSSDASQLKPDSSKDAKNIKEFNKFSKGFDDSKKKSYPTQPQYAVEPQQYSSTFMEFLPENEENQKMYSAMSPTWVGDKKTTEAIKNGTY